MDRIPTLSARPTTRVLFLGVLLIAVGLAVVRIHPRWLPIPLMLALFGGAMLATGLMLMVFCVAGQRLTPKWRKTLIASAALGAVLNFTFQISRSQPNAPSETRKHAFHLYLDGSYSSALLWFDRLSDCRDRDIASEARILAALSRMLQRRSSEEVLKIAGDLLPAIKQERRFVALRQEVERAFATTIRALEETGHDDAADELQILVQESLARELPLAQ